MSQAIELQQPESGIGSQLAEIIKVIKSVTNSKSQSITFDFNRITFVEPVFILSLCAYIDFLDQRGYDIHLSKINLRISSYLQTIYFPGGLRPDELAAWKASLHNFSNKNYLPILNFPASTQSNESEIRDNLLSKINDLLQSNLGLSAEYKSGISYPISEMTDNIIEHSGVSRGWMSAQYYPNQGYLEICIADTGKTLLGSYQDNGFEHVTNDLQAIENATEGVSTKSIERGNGIPTSRRMIVEGLNGKFVLISGEAILYNDRLTEFPVHWNGTIFALRLPSQARNFQYLRYVS